MDSQVLASVAAEERAYTDKLEELREFADRLARGDSTLMDEGEGGNPVPS